MERKSRVSRFQELRDQMLETQIENEKNVDLSQEVEFEEAPVYQPVREKVATTPDFKVDNFHNEYLDEFIREVKEYNIKKGTAVSQDTQINVLKGLTQTEEERDNYVEEIHNEPILEDIFQQVEALIDPSVELESIVEEVNHNPVEVVPPTPVQEEVAPILNVRHENEESLLDQTRKIEIKIDEYKENVHEISNKVNRTNIVLNMIVAILILLIIIIVGIAIYWALNLRG